jgi:phage/conjugal plasmid C-4 type zinc finger TraR family protein
VTSGWVPDGAITDQAEDTVNDAVARCRTQIPSGKGTDYCIECEEPIPEARKRAVPGARLCVSCQSELDRKNKRGHSLYNRRGSMDSQLK